MTSFVVAVGLWSSRMHVKAHGALIADDVSGPKFQQVWEAARWLLFCRVLSVNTSLFSFLTLLPFPIQLIGEPHLHLVSPLLPELHSEHLTDQPPPCRTQTIPTSTPSCRTQRPLPSTLRTLLSTVRYVVQSLQPELSAPILLEEIRCVARQSIAVAFLDGHLRLCSPNTYASSTQRLPHINFRLC